MNGRPVGRLRSAVENLTLLYRLGLQLANSDEWPSWKPTSEFGQVRAASGGAQVVLRSRFDLGGSVPAQALQQLADQVIAVMVVVRLLGEFAAGVIDGLIMGFTDAV